MLRLFPLAFALALTAPATAQHSLGTGVQYAWKCNTCCRRRGLQYVCGCC